jgi:propanol-preferring alcohol dehydrogenase
MGIILCERAHHSGIGEDGFYAPYAALSTRAISLVPDSKFLSNFVC